MKRLYARAGRLAHRLATPAIKLYFTPTHQRVRVLVLTPDASKIVLVRSWFGHQKWSLPGGGIGRNEIAKQAAIREVREETGLQLAPKAVRHIGDFANPSAKANFTVACFMATANQQALQLARHHRLEILDVAWFACKNLPAGISPTVGAALKLAKL